MQTNEGFHVKVVGVMMKHNVWNFYNKLFLMPSYLNILSMLSLKRWYVSRLNYIRKCDVKWHSYHGYLHTYVNNLCHTKFLVCVNTPNIIAYRNEKIFYLSNKAFLFHFIMYVHSSDINSNSDSIENNLQTLDFAWAKY